MNKAALILHDKLLFVNEASANSAILAFPLTLVVSYGLITILVSSKTSFRPNGAVFS